MFFFYVWTKKKVKINFRLIKKIYAKKLLILKFKPFKLKFRKMLKLRNSQNAKAKDCNLFQHFDI